MTLHFAPRLCVVSTHHRIRSAERGILNSFRGSKGKHDTELIAKQNCVKVWRAKEISWFFGVWINKMHYKFLYPFSPTFTKFSCNISQRKNRLPFTATTAMFLCNNNKRKLRFSGELRTPIQYIWQRRLLWYRLGKNILKNWYWAWIKIQGVGSLEKFIESHSCLDKFKIKNMYISNSDVVKTVTFETETWLKFRDETETSSKSPRLEVRDRDLRLQNLCILPKF